MSWVRSGLAQAVDGLISYYVNTTGGVPIPRLPSKVGAQPQLAPFISKRITICLFLILIFSLGLQGRKTLLLTTNA